jgi:hypothetical protein
VPALDRWIELSEPDQDLRLVVTDWVLSRAQHPYRAVRRETGFDNLWYGTVPQSRHGDDLAVMCSYWIYERERLIRCESIASLALPH